MAEYDWPTPKVPTPECLYGYAQCQLKFEEQQQQKANTDYDAEFVFNQALAVAAAFAPNSGEILSEYPDLGYAVAALASYVQWVRDNRRDPYRQPEDNT